MPISPSFPFFPSDFLGDPNTLRMRTADEIGAYCLLIFVAWEQDNRLPNDMDELADLARMPVDQFKILWEKKLNRCFEFIEKSNEFFHPRLEKIIKDIRGFRKQKSRAGKESGRKRREKKELDTEQVFDSVQTEDEQKVNENEPSSSFSSSSSISKEEEKETHTQDAGEWSWAVKQILEAFPYYLPDRLTPALVGHIESDVKLGDEAAWTETVELYKRNFNPMTNSYLPDRIGTVLDVFRKKKAVLAKNGHNQNGSPGSGESSQAIANRIGADAEF